MLFSTIRANIRLFGVIIQLLQSELERQASSNSPSDMGDASPNAGKLTTLIHRLIPWARQYSAWLISQPLILASETADEQFNSYALELGTRFARVLNSLISLYAIPEIENVDYLLEEDEDTVGFLPLDAPVEDRRKARYYHDDLAIRKLNWHDKGTKRLDSTREALGRIRDIVADGAYLAAQEVTKSEFSVNLTEKIIGLQDQA